MPAWFSVPQQWLMPTTWNKQTSTILAQKSAAVLWHCYRSKDKIPRALKRFYVNCCNFFYAEDFVGRIGIMLNFTPLRSPDSETSMQVSKRTLWVFTDCKLMKNQGTKMHIHLGCSMTHGRAKLVPHWIPQFHQIFTSSASSKTKTDKKFSYVFVRT